MGKRRSIAEARSNLPRLVREAEGGEVVELTRRGDPVAVLMGRRQFERLTARQRSFCDAYRAFRERFDLVELALDPDELFGGGRDATGGRDVRL